MRSQDYPEGAYGDPAMEMVIVKLASPPLAADAHIDGVSLPAYQAIADHLVQRE
tara:strand:+ start:232 stop:393 length:162 start_codon:yes stop_codon:yes gene_type:complete